MFLQTSKYLNPISEWGCYFCVILALAEKVSGRVFTAPEVLELWLRNAREGDLDFESTVKNPAGLLADLPGGLVFLGWKSADYELGEGEFAALRWKHPVTGFIHFTLGNPREGGWDPLGISKTASEGFVLDMRVFKVGPQNEGGS